MFLLFFLLVSVFYNSLTRIDNAPAWLNYILIAVSSCGGLAVMFAYDYGKLFATGTRGIKYIPGTTSAAWLSAVGMSFRRRWQALCCLVCCLSCRSQQ